MNARRGLTGLLLAILPPDASAHSGRIERNGFELSDLALFLCAVALIAFVRHRLRHRHQRRD
jgi:hypothetical protein